MTKSNYFKPDTEIVCISLKNKLLQDADDIITTSQQFTNQNMLFDDLEDHLDENLQTNTEKGGLWDE